MKFAVIEEKLIPEPFLTVKQATFPISSLDHFYEQLPLNPQFTPNPALKNYLTGKQLLLDELPFSMEELYTHYENGFLIFRKGIVFEKKSAKCRRCGNTDQRYFASFYCSRCREVCTYCRKCLMMGRVSTCTPLLSWAAEPPQFQIESLPNSEHHPASLIWEGTLSPGQETASSRVAEAIGNNQDLLVWAVCGAGKTEVLFAGIERALKENKRLCIATPRTDVVLELTPRLRKVFPGITTASLYGGSEERHTYAPLTISTTHQLLRFYKAFDTIILDEVDAFPYSVDETLQYAVRNARKDSSAMIYLTATPDRKWQRESRTGKRAFVTIPARYHRHPLPVPRFVWCGNWQNLLRKNKLPANVLQWLKERLASDKQALLFVPKIALFEKILPIIRSLHTDIETVHAEDPERKEKVQKMRDKKILFLVTTTILERGVTFPNLDVAVLGAEDHIFTESALVQIAGRVGRSAQYPKGDIVFFHYGRTEAMVRARKQIISMNKEAVEKGLIDMD